MENVKENKKLESHGTGKFEYTFKPDTKLVVFFEGSCVLGF